jgi:DNA-binding transcriptional LysR family regulator
MSENINDLLAFVAVATERSFTKAAAKTGQTQSGLSRTIRKLEAQLGVQLFLRTTRSVSPTEAGERLLASVGPLLDEIKAELAALGDLRDKPAGTIRITTGEHAAETILWPKILKLLPDYPELKVEIVVDHGLTDIAAERFDAGVRLGDSVEKDMIAVRIGPDQRLIAVGSPSYFGRNAPPLVPHDLLQHSCINLRLATHGAIYAWEFEKDRRQVRMRVEGQLVFNTIRPMINAAVAGLGVSFVPEDSVAGLLAQGALVEVLGDWCQPFAGFHLYYPRRRQKSPAFQVVVEALRYRP